MQLARDNPQDIDLPGTALGSFALNGSGTVLIEVRGQTQSWGAKMRGQLVETVERGLDGIEDDYVRAVMDRYGVRTKTEAVDLALRHLVGQPMTREEVVAMRGAHAIGDLPGDVPPPGAT